MTRGRLLYFIGGIVVLIMSFSCTVYEEMTFYKNGKISYNFSFDASEFAKMFPDKGLVESTLEDSIISISDVIKKDKKQILQTYPDLKTDLDNVSQFYIRITQNSEKSEFKISLSGNFNNAVSLNEAFVSMGKIVAKTQTERSRTPIDNDLMKWIGNIPTYTWDGKTMTCTAQKIISDENLVENGNDEVLDNLLEGSESDWKNFLTGSKMTVKYNFPNKIESVSDTTDLLTQDGRSVVIEYNGTMFIQSPEKTNIEVRIIR